MSTIQATAQAALAQISNNDLQAYLQQYSKQIKQLPSPINFIVSIWKSFVNYLALCEQKTPILTTDKGFVKISKSSALHALKLSDAVIKTGEKVSTAVKNQAFLHSLLKKTNLTSEDLIQVMALKIGIQAERRVNASDESLQMTYKLTHDVTASGIAIQLCNEFNAKGDAQLSKKAQDAEVLATALRTERLLMAGADQESALAMDDLEPATAAAEELEEKKEPLHPEAEVVVSDLIEELITQTTSEQPAMVSADQEHASSLPVEPATVAAEELEEIEEGEVLSPEKQLECIAHGTQLGRDLIERSSHQRGSGRLAPTQQSNAMFDTHPTDEQLVKILAFTKKNGANLARDEESSTYVAYLNGLDQESKLTLKAMAEEVARVKTGPYLNLIRSL
jgi:hypothetical protein